MSRSFRWLSAFLTFVIVPRAAVAQVCHAPETVPEPAPVVAPTETPPHTWIEVRGESATVDGMTAGHWEGITLGGGWRSPHLAFRLAVPAYQLAHDGVTERGVGDVSGDVQITAWRRDPIAAGAGLAVALPTGDVHAGLGAGHAMIVPALWTNAHHRRLALRALTFLGHAIGPDPHAHHHPEVMVNPMNPVEAGAKLDLGAKLAERWTPSISAAIGVPLSDSGTTRAIVGCGLTWDPAPRWQLNGDLTTPLVGEPFAVRATIGLTLWL